MEQLESKESGGVVARKIHRRIGKDIPKNFVCGDKNCGKSYGTNAALYTHIKNKHDGQEPKGTKRSSDQGKKGKSKDQQQQKIQVVVCKKCKLKECNCKSNFDLKEVQLFNDNNFMLFVRYICLFGEDGSRQGGIWVRVVDDQVEYLSKKDIQDLIKRINSQYKLDVKLTPQQTDYLIFSSNFWDKNNIIQLYEGLIVSSKLLNKKLIQKALQNSGKCKLFLSRLQIQQKQLNVIIHLFCS